MNEQLPSTQSPELTPRRAPGEAYLAPSRENPDWRRLEVAATRFGDRIAEGLSQAMEQDASIDNSTARLIAHVLGRAFGRESALAGYGRTGTGYYEELREEYLTLYECTEAGWVTDLIDHYGGYLIRNTFPAVNSIQYVGTEFGELARLLVPTKLKIGDGELVVHVPGSYGAEAIDQLAGILAKEQAPDNPALQAFLSLSDVNAMSQDLLGDFHAHYIGEYPMRTDAIYELAGVEDRIEELEEYAADRQLIMDEVNPDYEALAEDMSDGFDLVEGDDITYAFYK